MAEARRGWRFELGLSPEVRQANALEYMAHYLDRIDLQLTRIATVAEKIEMTLKATAQRR